MVRPSDGAEYYAYILLYVDDILCSHHNAETVLTKFDKYFKLKPDSVQEPDIYLGDKVRPMTLENGAWAWALSLSKYVQERCQNVQNYIKDNVGGRWKLPNKAPNPFVMGYTPELDASTVLNPSLESYYQSQIGFLRWLVEIGRVDINTEVSVLASCLYLPREGHIDAVLHVYGYLCTKHNARLALDPSYPDIKWSQFLQCDWKYYYYNIKEDISPNTPEPHGK